MIEKKENIWLKDYSTIKIGGIAKEMFFPKNENEVKEIVESRDKIFVLGNGSNTLFLDDGFDGTVINMSRLNEIAFDGESVVVGAGVKLFSFEKMLCENGLSGLEWAFGIPASIGGMVVGNAGSFGFEIGDFVEEVRVLRDGEIQTLRDVKFSYRNSDLKNCVVLSVKLRLKREKSEKIAKNMQEFYQKKILTQPLDKFSLGSVFKRKNDCFPAKIIDNMGLKGVKIGEAEISTKHAGFIINSGDATSSDFLALAEFIEEKFAKIGQKFEREIVIAK